MQTKHDRQPITTDETATPDPVRKFRVRLFIDLSSSYGRSLLQGVSEYVKKFKNWEFETTFSYFGEKHPDKVRIDKTKIDGIITFTPNENILAEVIRSGIPAIIKGSDQPVRDYINFHTDNIMLSKKVFDHFRHLGFIKFAYCGFGHLHWSKERCEAFLHIIARNGYGLDVYPKRPAQKSKKWADEKPILQHWLRSLPKPIGLLAANDFRGKEVLEACLDANIKVPEEIAVLGVDNDDCICPFTSPPLSSIGRHFRKAGYEAAVVLTTLMSGNIPDSHEIILEPQEVTQRQSTDILAVENPTVVEALLFIRANKHKSLSIAEVAEHVAVHSRILYNLFIKYLNHTVYEEIKRVRTDEIARLLLESDLTIAEIAREMGFSNTDNFSRYFFQAKKMSPTEYRNHFLPFEDNLRAVQNLSGHDQDRSGHGPNGRS